MSTTTTNYQFHKPELTDPADITKLNPNWDNIDSELKNRLPLTGGTMTGTLYANAGIISGNTIRSSSPATNNLGNANIPWNVLYGKTVSFRGDGSGQAYGDANIVSLGTTDDKGELRFTLGNNIPIGNAGNACGRIRMYGEGSGYTNLLPGNNGSDNVIITLPDESGTLALNSDVTNLTLASGTWSDNTYTISHSLVHSGSIVEIAPASTITATQLKALQKANIVDGGITDGTIVLKALGTTPTINIPVVIIVRRDT